MNFKRNKTSFIYSARKHFLQKNRHPCIGTVGRLILSFSSQTYLYYFSHLWPFNRTPPTWWCCGRFFGHHKLDIKNISSIKGMTSQEAEGSWTSIGDFWHFRYLLFLTSLTAETTTFCFGFFQSYTQFQIPLFHPLKYQIFFRHLH